MDKVNKYMNKLKLQSGGQLPLSGGRMQTQNISGGRMREFGIQNYIEHLSKHDSKLNLDTLDEVFTSLENMYLFNEHVCETKNKSNEYHGNNIDCHGNNNTNKYIDLYKDLYSNAKSKWKSSSCYKNEQHQCINFNEVIKHWAPKLYDISRNINQNGSANINFLLKHYTKKYIK